MISHGTKIKVFTGNSNVPLAKAIAADADLLVLGDGLEIDSLFSRGKTALWQGKVLMKGKFE